MLRKIAIAFVSILAVFSIYVALQPSDFILVRETTIAAPPAAVFPYVNNAKMMNEWNPWTKKDPQAKINYSGPDAGLDSASDWDGNSELGAGHSVIVESRENEYVRVRLDFIRPFKDTSFVDYTLTPQGNMTKVAWGMQGKSGFIPRFFCTLFNMNMEKMMQETFDKGLADLKSIVEAKVK